MENNENKVVNKQDFEFVQADSKIYDKKFETKPIGYFKDAMIRFSKNRGNVIASIILGLIVLGTIFIPIFSSKNYELLESELSFLPPRIPLLENWGMDGNIFKEGVPADPNAIDPETGLYLPVNHDPETVDISTLKNYSESCTDKEELCIGGEVKLSVDPNSTGVTITSDKYFTLSPANNSLLVIDILEFENTNGSTLNVLVQPTWTSPYTQVATTTEAGILTIDLSALYPDMVYDAVTKVKLELVSDTSDDYIIFNSVKITDDTQTEPIQNIVGLELSEWAITEGAGRTDRQNGERIITDFDFKAYDAAFGEQYRIGFSNSDYQALMAENPQCVQMPDPKNPDGWLFPEGCPIVKVIKQNEAIVIDGVEYFSYELIINYKLYAGYEEIPYFLFGTDFNGRDLFTLLWVATRTSLLIGVVVAAINISVGVVYGAISGYYGGIVDLILQRITEVIGRIPWLVTLSIFVSFFGPGIQTLILILIVSGWIGPQAVTRTQFYRYKGREYVLASRTLGAKDARLIFRHILPNGIGTIITSAILTIPYAIFSESTISYLGFGVGHGQEFNVLGIKFSGVSVGVLLADGRNYLMDKPYLTVFPSILISILMITFNMFGNALRDAFNPALRGSE